MTFLKGCIEQIGRILDDCFYWPWQIHLPPFQAEHFFFLHFFFFFLSPIRVEIYYLILINGNLSCWSTNFISNRQNTLINKLNSILIGCNTQPIKNQKIPEWNLSFCLTFHKKKRCDKKLLASEIAAMIGVTT